MTTTAPGYEAAVAYLGCDGTAISTQAIASKYGTKAAVHLCALYNQVTVGRCQLLKPLGDSDFDNHFFNRWRALSDMESIPAKQLFVRILEIIDPQWTDKYSGSAVERADIHINVQESSSIDENQHPSNVTSCPTEADLQRKAKLKKVQDRWLRNNWDPELKFLDSSSKRTKEGSRWKDVRDCIQEVIDEEREFVAEAIEQYKKGNPVTSRSSSSVEGILKPARLSENGKSSFMKIGGICDIEKCDCWIVPLVHGQKPKPRYQHGAFELDYKMCVAGGFNGTDWYEDIQVLDLMSLSWSKVDGAENSSLTLPATPCSGQPLICWNDRLFAIAAIAGRTGRIDLKELNKPSRTWCDVDTHGVIPTSRCGHSTTLVGSNLVIFGGEDGSGVVMNDLHILNLETMRWDDLKAIGAAPFPRSGHAASCLEDKYVFIFGGKGQDKYYNDLYKFDLSKSEWKELAPGGVIPAPRGGHAGVMVDANWVIVGGRDFQAGFCETFVLNTRNLIWSFLTKRLPATEGMSLIASSYDGEDFLVSFGGYDGIFKKEGKCSDEVRVLRLSTYARCESDRLPLNLSDDDLETSETKMSEELKARVSKVIEEEKTLATERKEELNQLVVEREKALGALLLKEPISKEVLGTPHKMATRKRKLRLLGEADVSESAEEAPLEIWNQQSV